MLRAAERLRQMAKQILQS